MTVGDGFGLNTHDKKLSKRLNLLLPFEMVHINSQGIMNGKAKNRQNILVFMPSLLDIKSVHY